MYVKNDITFKLRNDISLFVEGHSESVFIELYRIRKTQLLEKYIEFLEQMKTYPWNISVI